ncbi:MAG: hypothetical protein RML12_09915 [Xanthomonadales bacterium]|nr:hypothetical protein [Xanthomonadales bacterium]
MPASPTSRARRASPRPGSNEWARAILNRPLIAGDRLWTESGARLELELGGSALRLDQRSAAEILDLDDEVAQFFLSEGRANLYVRRIFERQIYEIATPLAAVVVRSPASLTVEVPPVGRSAAGGGVARPGRGGRRGPPHRARRSRGADRP